MLSQKQADACQNGLRHRQTFKKQRMKRIKVHIAGNNSDPSADKLVFLDKDLADRYCSRENPGYTLEDAFLPLPETMEEVRISDLAAPMLLQLAKLAASSRATEVAICLKHPYQGKEYFSRLAVQTYETGEERVLEQMAEDMADEICRSEGLVAREIIKKAILAGYDLHRSDME